MPNTSEDRTAKLWTTKAGKQIPIQKMGSSHLRNAIAMVERKTGIIQEGDYWYGLVIELHSRGLKRIVVKPGIRPNARRPHGFAKFGNGGVNYTYGVMDYCDDGNGNVWDMEDELDCEQDY